MFSSWLLLPLFLTMARAFSGSRHLGSRPGVPEIPTCEQLRAFWEMFSRTDQMGHVTNEIPVLPFKIYESIEPYSAGPRRKHHTKQRYQGNRMNTFSNFIDSTNSLLSQPWETQQSLQPDSLLLPELEQTPSKPEWHGTFGDFHQQKAEKMSEFGSASAVPLGDKKNGDTDFYIAQYGSPDEVDSFGRFVDSDTDYPHFTLTKTPKDSPRSSEISCEILISTDCTNSEQCTCVESTLKCIHGKCLNPSIHNNIAEHYGTWHDGPVPISQLHSFPRLKKRSSKSIYMK